MRLVLAIFALPRREEAIEEAFAQAPNAIGDALMFDHVYAAA
jgi:hypothetical protein